VQSRKDYETVPTTVPALFASLKDVGHLGTFFVHGGGRMAKATVDLMNWKLRGDASKKAQFCGTPALNADGWSLASKNGFC
jgi:hypothetical protein